MGFADPYINMGRDPPRAHDVQGFGFGEGMSLLSQHMAADVRGG